ncbi:uncharacterized protein LOC122014101 [Zingiber officinale]|uniref:uncharacterized protein LOC122014101 n=1 Tax=Zingiber officinale TaxID=94328 RepID=UPI001C4A8007|nr:uncharacterized protein LOC122014101 [Zingiber officinale]
MKTTRGKGLQEPHRCPLSSLPLDLCRKDGTFAFDYNLFFSYFKELVGKEVMVELNNDLAIRGTLDSVDQYLNIKSMAPFLSLLFTSQVDAQRAQPVMVSKPLDGVGIGGRVRGGACSRACPSASSNPPLICARDSGEAEEKDVRSRDMMLRSKSVHRRARSLSPLRNLPFRWRPHGAADEERGGDGEKAPDRKKIKSEEAPAPPVSASSRSSSSSSASSSSSSGWSSKRWIFLKDFLHRKKSEGSGHAKEKFWRTISFSAPKDSPRPTSPPEPETTPQPAESAARREQMTQPRRQQRPVNGLGARRWATAPSAHEWLYTANRAQAEEMNQRTFLPYRQGLLGCLWFGSKGYGAIDGFARSLNHVPWR